MPRSEDEGALTLFVAGRGAPPAAGLYRYHRSGGTWHGRQLAAVPDLAALAAHPTRKVIYGVSGTGDGTLHAWGDSGDGFRDFGIVQTGGREPCHVSVDPLGRFLAVTNYASGTLALQMLGTDGSLQGDAHLVHFSGNGPDPERQDGPHPHQAVFQGGALHVVDLGSDCVRHFTIASADAASTLFPSGTTPLPPGTGPRHLTVLPDGTFVVSGELASTVLAGQPAGAGKEWTELPSTHRTGPARTRHLRNYPGDIQSSPDGAKIYVANRGYDTISTFEKRGTSLRMISELDANAAWPQHLLVAGRELFIAAWDSSLVTAMPLVDGVPCPPRPQFDCQGASWLLAAPAAWQ